MAQLFAAHHPERVEKLVLINTLAGAAAFESVPEYATASDRPFDPAELILGLQELVATWGVRPEFMVDWMMPSQSTNAAFVRWVGRLQRQSASPADVERQVASVAGLDAMDCVADIKAPTMVMHVKDDKVLHVAYGRHLAAQIEGATYVELPGEDHFLWVMPHWRQVADPVLEFISGQSVQGSSERRFATVLFTDMVGSTVASSKAGDTAWRDTLDSHDKICRDVVDFHRGSIIKNTGDGLMAASTPRPTPSPRPPAW